MIVTTLRQWINKPFAGIILTITSAIFGFLISFFIPLRVSLALRYDLALPLAGIFLLLWAAWRLPRPWGDTFSAGITSAIFGAALVALWQTGIHEIYQVFGLLPWFDAQGYYSEALRLLDGDFFTQISARRPLFPAYFSTLLLATGRDLRLSIGITTFIAGISTWLLGNEFQKSEKHASIPAAITTLLFLYYRIFNGVVLTETIGYSLGVLSLALLWNAAVNHKLRPALTGLFCMTLALSARPGAVFSLPLLVIWVGFFLKGVSHPVRKLIFASAVVAGGLAVNLLLTAFLAPGVSSSYSNFAQTFYGLVNGGVGWRAVYEDHPEFFASGNESVASRQIYQAALQTLRNHPEKTVEGAVRSVRAFFSTRHNSAFNLLRDENTPRDPDIQSAPFVYLSRMTGNILLILLLPVAIIARRNPKYTLLLAVNLGILLSLPFAPPWDAENTRAYASSISAVAAAIVFVLQYLIQRGKFPEILPNGQPTAAYGLSALLIIAMTLTPVIIRLTAQAPILPDARCPENEAALVTRVSASSTIRIGANPSDPFTIPHARFIEKLDQFPDASIGELVKSISPGNFISQQNNLMDNGRAVWLVAPLNLLPASDHPTTFCGNWGADPRTKFIFYAKNLAQ